jgi:uncharacterized protein
MVTLFSGAGMGERPRVVGVLAGACLGYVAGWLFLIASTGALSETTKRYAYTLQGGGGEGANWGEPLFYAVLLVVPNAGTLGGALVGAAAAFLLARAVDSEEGLLTFLRNHAVAFTLMGLAFVGVSGWFVDVQWRRARADVTRYREGTEPGRVVFGAPDPAFLQGLQQECEAGQAGACTFLGQMYQFGQGVPIELPRALENYRKGCERSFAAACSSVGAMYEKGEGVGADAPAALVFYERGCSGGYAEACRNIGTLWQRGTSGVPRDLVKTVAALGRACEVGDGWSCFTVGVMHERAQGTRRDYARAAELYRKACDVRYALGCQYLGDSYAHGEGVARDDARGRALYVEAAGMFEKDCAGGDAYACSALGSMYREGRGFPVDLDKARTLFDRACHGGNNQACGSSGP